MKRTAVVLGLAAAAGAIWYLRRPTHTTAAPDVPPPVSQPAAPNAPRPEAAADAARPVAAVTRLASADDRRRLSDRIASARTTRAATSAPPRPALPAEAGSATISVTQLRTAMREVIPHLAQCYQDALPSLANPVLKIVAELTLTGDPDVGTLIDAGELADDEGRRLPQKLDDCLRSTFMSLALPPLAEGEKVEVRYPFVFESN